MSSAGYKETVDWHMEFYHYPYESDSEAAREVEREIEAAPYNGDRQAHYKAAKATSRRRHRVCDVDIPSSKGVAGAAGTAQCRRAYKWQYDPADHRGGTSGGGLWNNSVRRSR